MNALRTRDRDEQLRRLPTLLGELAAAASQVRGGQRVGRRHQGSFGGVQCTLPLRCKRLQVVDRLERGLWRALVFWVPGRCSDARPATRAGHLWSKNSLRAHRERCSGVRAAVASVLFPISRTAFYRCHSRVREAP